MRSASTVMRFYISNSLCDRALVIAADDYIGCLQNAIICIGWRNANLGCTDHGFVVITVTDRKGPAWVNGAIFCNLQQRCTFVNTCSCDLPERRHAGCHAEPVTVWPQEFPDLMHQCRLAGKVDLAPCGCITQLFLCHHGVWQIKHTDMVFGHCTHFSNQYLCPDKNFAS